MSTNPNSPSDDDLAIDDTRGAGTPDAHPPVPEVAAAASAPNLEALKLAARRRAWTVVAIVFMSLATLVAFGALIWQALQPT